MKHVLPMLALFTTLAFPVGSSTAIAAKTYPLVCRGGGAMKATYTLWRERGQAFRINFIRARQGSRVRPPGPGECAWMDRALNASEPTSLNFYSEKKEHFRGMTMEMREGQLVAINYGNDVVRYLAEAIGHKRLFYLHVFNDRDKGWLNIVQPCGTPRC